MRIQHSREDEEDEEEEEMEGDMDDDNEDAFEEEMRKEADERMLQAEKVTKILNNLGPYPYLPPPFPLPDLPLSWYINIDCAQLCFFFHSFFVSLFDISTSQFFFIPVAVPNHFQLKFPPFSRLL